MVEVNITYETLFDLLRREKSRNELQELESDFYEDVKHYLNEKKQSMTNKTSSLADKEKIKIQIKNAKKIIKELYELREKKILFLAINKVKTESSLINTANLLEKEKRLYEETCALLRKYKDETLSLIDEEIVKISSEEPKESIEPQKESSKKESSGDKKVTMLSNLPKFVGLDKNIYGPYNKGDSYSMPKEIADLLIQKGRAKEA